ncbi:catalase [Corallococcus terminator]|uniref:Catalase n=1 Tax=Corallococcus terminator TaxID=2316733 RepID=A0A3A8I8N9_9BACT|nr:catalase [Corallococcus terminator]RKG79807.1 catalase [Corallococcus terminator]
MSSQKQPDAVHVDEKSKDTQLAKDRSDGTGNFLTTDQGLRIEHTDDSLKIGARGPTLLEDFHLREKVMRFDHERIPERVVHARGSAAHGYFQVYQPMSKYTRAGFLQDPSRKTPVFVRFSTVAGSRGSADTVRDVRGFAVKFYTDEGNFDLVGNNIPVFFVQDGIKFPDFVHAAKPEPHHEMPQAATAHDSFWDFVSLVPETMHMVMWAMSDRGIPRSYRMMEGFGVHTFRFINEQNESRFVKFHWKPLLGVHSLVWDEAQKLAGKDADFHRRDLWESIEMGDFPEYELGVQIIEEADAQKLGIELLDATKLVPEELVPVQRIGKLVLNRNPDNFFAETEQVAYCVSNVVPGIGFTDDPLMQARLFSYLDTQLTRLGGPNFAELPINRPVAPVHNHQQDGFGRHTVNTSRANYHPNSLSGGCPFLASQKQGGYVHPPEQVSGKKQRVRAESFQDHYSQAALFFNSLTPPEQEHLIDACRFELGKVETLHIRERVLEHFAKVDGKLATEVAKGLGLPTPAAQPPAAKGPVATSPALSMELGKGGGIKSRRIAVLVADGVDSDELMAVRKELEGQGAHVKVIAKHLGTVKAANGQAVKVDKSAITTASIEYDGVYIPGGAASVATLKKDGEARHFVQEAYLHCKTVAASTGATDVLKACEVDPAAPGIVTGTAQALGKAFVTALAKHRHWDRVDHDRVPA